jgi:flagellin-like hook-associated protein FlgL
MSDITLSSYVRTNLLSLQQTASLMGRTQERLATNKAVNSAVDDPAKYFAAQQHQNRANDLLALKSEMNEAIQAVKAADSGITAIQSMLAQLKGIATSARSADAGQIADLETQYQEVATQITNLANDSGYKGTNFLGASFTLTVTFNENNTTSIDITGADTTVAASAYDLDAANVDLATSGGIDAAIDTINGVVDAYRSLASSLATGLSVVTARQEFTQKIADVLETGAENLVNADTNREGANLLALQTRQQLSTVALSMSSQASQSILRLF